jgi:ParB-like chromosome segregation protein Spo0J
MNETITKLPPATPLAMANYVPHPLANLFPMIKGTEFDNLKADIAKQGILQPITLYDDGSGLKILDGRNRFAAGKAVGYKFTAANFKEFKGTPAEAEAFVISTNVHRRHLTNSQKQEFIRTLIEKYPGSSNRQIARICQQSHVTVGQVRERLLNPPELKKFEEFKTTFDELPDDQRRAFVKEFEADLRELLSL